MNVVAKGSVEPTHMEKKTCCAAYHCKGVQYLTPLSILKRPSPSPCPCGSNSNYEIVSPPRARLLARRQLSARMLTKRPGGGRESDTEPIIASSTTHPPANRPNEPRTARPCTPPLRQARPGHPRRVSSAVYRTGRCIDVKSRDRHRRCPLWGFAEPCGDHFGCNRFHFPSVSCAVESCSQS